ncbi:protein phosphatase 1 regulatory subunit 32 isoform X2 [Archocentrus centrarchus]|uniref:protein phosphatase 1 regulatory subunit 32 isoform X2 n=1 Tax=Archocentrus centrarchus TaxID=63155 RepID=UPI0011E9FD74|nr:protein phosphatase 1 regulatory subunit 32-like isoform X2 [Archocentrus centrarchus]
MAEQGRIVMPAAGAIGRRGQLTSNAIKLHNTYVASYDSGRMRFTYLRRPSETGFTSNQRPAIYYRPSLDHIDNPQFGLLLSDSFVSQTKRHYQPHIHSDCSGSSNIVNKPRHSGFHQLRIQPKAASVEEKTEYQSIFVFHHPTPAVSQNNVTVGPKGRIGFTKAAELQVNTSFLGEPHQTPSTVMKTDFMPFSLLQGPEAKSGLCSRSCRETGFTRGDITPLAHPSSLLPSLSTKTNTKAPTVSTIGKKEPTGHVLNAQKKQVFPNATFDFSNFTTHYQSNFGHRADLEKLKSGNSCAGIVSSKMENGYNRRDMDRYILRDNTFSHL